MTKVWSVEMLEFQIKLFVLPERVQKETMWSLILYVVCMSWCM